MCHGFARPQNRLSFYAVAEAFLSQYLGGRCEPIGADLNDSSLTIAVGEGFVVRPRRRIARTAVD